jgi:hypothetical protein
LSRTPEAADAADPHHAMVDGAGEIQASSAGLSQEEAA